MPDEPEGSPATKRALEWDGYLAWVVSTLTSARSTNCGGWSTSDDFEGALNDQLRTTTCLGPVIGLQKSLLTISMNIYTKCFRSNESCFGYETRQLYTNVHWSYKLFYFFATGITIKITDTKDCFRSNIFRRFDAHWRRSGNSNAFFSRLHCRF